MGNLFPGYFVIKKWADDGMKEYQLANRGQQQFAAISDRLKTGKLGLRNLQQMVNIDSHSCLGKRTIEQLMQTTNEIYRPLH